VREVGSDTGGVDDIVKAELFDARRPGGWRRMRRMMKKP
jgi:hypothetical protein